MFCNYFDDFVNIGNILNKSNKELRYFRRYTVRQHHHHHHHHHHYHHHHHHHHHHYHHHHTGGVKYFVCVVEQT